MRISLKYPSKKVLDSFHQQEKQLPYTYPEVGASASQTLSKYDNDYNYTPIGQGEAAWQDAKQALRDWGQFPAGWTKVYPIAPLEKDEVVVVMIRLWGIWWKNSSRIVYTWDEPNKFGFAYGTLPGHFETGEEAFWVERDGEAVTYHIRAFSKPRFWMVRLGYPIARMYQRKFVLQSLKTMANRTGRR